MHHCRIRKWQFSPQVGVVPCLSFCFCTVVLVSHWSNSLDKWGLVLNIQALYFSRLQLKFFRWVAIQNQICTSDRPEAQGWPNHRIFLLCRQDLEQGRIFFFWRNRRGSPVLVNIYINKTRKKSCVKVTEFRRQKKRQKVQKITIGALAILL